MSINLSPEMVAQFMHKLANSTRKTGIISESAKQKILKSFDAYDPDVVTDALNAYLAMDITPSKHGKGKNEKYVLGIMANKQAEKDGRINTGNRRAERGTDRQHTTSKGGTSARPSGEDAGERIQALAEGKAGSLDCSF